MPQIRISEDPASESVTEPTPRHNALPGLIRSLREKQRREQIEGEPATVPPEDPDRS